MPRLSKKPYKIESDAYTVLELTLTQALNYPSALSNRFLARTRAISKSIAALSAQHDLAPGYMEPIERALATLAMPDVCRYNFCLDSQPDEPIYSMLIIHKDPKTNAYKIVSSFRWCDRLVMRDTDQSKLRATLYDKILDKRKTAEGRETVGEWLVKYDEDLFELTEFAA